MRRLVLNALVLLSAGLLLGGAAGAADGTAIGVDPDATARLAGKDRVLRVGADVSLGEQIVTGASGRVQILFSDQTRLVVGPGSALVIESYLFNGNTADKFAINALAGSFRFITGNSAKSAYSIKTPTASIAVRGTEFDFNVAGKRTDLLLFDGGVRLCAGANNCQELSARCALGVVEGGTARQVPHNSPAHQPLSQQFTMARFQSPLIGSFRVSGAGKCLQPSESIGAPQSIHSEGSGESHTPHSNYPTNSNSTTSPSSSTTSPTFTSPTSGGN